MRLFFDPFSSRQSPAMHQLHSVDFSVHLCCVQEGIGEGEGSAVRAMEFTKDVAQNFMPSYLPSTYTAQDSWLGLTTYMYTDQDWSRIEHLYVDVPAIYLHSTFTCSGCLESLPPFPLSQSPSEVTIQMSSPSLQKEALT